MPSHPPGNVSGRNLTSTKIQVNWTDIPEDFHNGILLGYTVLWRETSDQSATWDKMKVDANFTSAIFTNLSAYTNYTFKVAGFTKKGNGNFSSEIIVITEEEGKLLCILNLSIIFLKSSITRVSKRFMPGRKCC